MIRIEAQSFVNSVGADDVDGDGADYFIEDRGNEDSALGVVRPRWNWINDWNSGDEGHDGDDGDEGDGKESCSGNDDGYRNDNQDVVDDGDGGDDCKWGWQKNGVNKR